MCRNIKQLFNFDPPVTDNEIHDASMQFVRKISGFNKPSKINEIVFNQAVTDISIASKNLLISLETNSNPRDRDLEDAKTRLRSEKRFVKS